MTCIELLGPYVGTKDSKQRLLSVQPRRVLLPLLLLLLLLLLVVVEIVITVVLGFLLWYHLQHSCVGVNYLVECCQEETTIIIKIW